MAIPFSLLALYILAALMILLLPGAALAVWLPRRGGFLAFLADAVGLSIALTVLVALAGFLLQLRFDRPLLTGLYAACGLILLAGLVRAAVRGHKPRFNLKQVLFGLLGLAVLTGLIAWRFYQARDLVLPAWVDSVHHTLIVRVIMENGGLPATLDPYLPVDLNYHFGFHVLAALFSSMTGTEPAFALLGFGQVLNALIALSVYRLALELWQDARRAALSALLVGLVLQMPAYYLTWGRYTLITGLIVLPLAMASIIHLSRQPRSASAWVTTALLTAGVALSHLTAFLLLGFFTFILVVVRLLERSDPSDSVPENRWQNWIAPATAALAGVVLAGPWLLRLWGYYGADVGVALVSPFTSDQTSYGDYLLYLLGPIHNVVWLGLGALGLVLALLRKPARALAVWALLLALLTLPWGLRLGPFRPDHMAIVLFLPGALLAGSLVFSLYDLGARLTHAWLRHLAQATLLLVVLAGVGWGAWQTRSILNSDTILVDADDLQALDWVRQTTPPDARFLINTNAWMGSMRRGVDGGYWLLPYAGRQTILPPVVYSYGDPTYVEQITDWSLRMGEVMTCGEAFWSLVQEFGANYLYIKEGQGSLQPEGLAYCPSVVPVYRSGSVSVYEIIR